MISRSLLLVMLVLTCLQSFTTAMNGAAPEECCHSYQIHPLPVRVITEYKVTQHQCTKPGVIFTLNRVRRVCADPGVQWVNRTMQRIDERLMRSLNKPQTSV